MIVVEIQKTGDQVAAILTTHTDPNEAEQKYHTVLPYAAVSSVPVHSAVLLDDTGRGVKAETYYHEVS